MKKLVILLSFLVTGAFTINAQVSEDKPFQDKKEVKEQKQNTSEQPADPNAPVIKFEKTVHDYGTIEQHGNGTCEFKFTNTGKEPLILTNVRSSCGCTIPTWPRQPVLPGQSSTIKVKYDTKRLGVINKSIHVYSNATTPSVTLKIKGKVVAKDGAVKPVNRISKRTSAVEDEKK